MQLAVLRHDVDSAKQMLSADCRMFNDKPSSRPPFRFFRPPINMLEATLCAHCQEVPIQTCCVPQRRRFCCVLSYGPLEVDSGARHEIRHLVVAELRSRRARLSDLASKHLPPTTLRELGIGLSTPLDSKALETYTALLEHGIPVPKALYPGQRPLLLSFNVSCQFGGFLLAQALFDNGLCELNATFNGVTPLAGIFRVPDADGQKENMIR
jgi:hypothetical protein